MTVNAMFVDDDPSLLSSIRRQLFSLKLKWNVSYAERGAKALELLSEKSYDVVISDMRMPEMDGAELISRIRDKYPDTIRIILSGQSEAKQLEQALGIAHLILKKPCETRTIANIVERCSEMRRRLLSTTVCSLITRRDQWIGSAESVQQLLRLFRDSEVSAQKVSEVISQDLVISARVLGFVNSAYYGLSRHISDIEQAVVMLGVSTIKSIYTRIKAAEIVCLNPLANRLASEGMEHGLRVAAGACELLKVKKANPEWQADCFLAGVLHDIGMPLLASVAEKEYETILHDVHWGTTSLDQDKLIQLERERLGCTHAEVGAYQLAIWGFDPRILEAVLTHHDASNDKASIFTIANAIHEVSEPSQVLSP